jgi:hypothetical protein
MTKEIIKYQTLDQLVDDIGEARLKFYGAALVQATAFRVYVGRLINSAPNIEKKYGAGFISRIAAETKMSESTLKDIREMYELEKLSPTKEKKFIKEFPTLFHSWNDYLAKRLGRQKAIGAGESDEVFCNHSCDKHCKN